MEDNKVKKLRWYNLAAMSFSFVWGFGNIVNNYANQGLKVITSWILIMAIYFVPYVLIVGELGSTFRNEKGGVSSWIKALMGPTLAYFAGWTYWVVHVPYLAQKPQGIIIGIGWVLFQNGKLTKNMNPIVMQFICLAIFILFVWVSSRGIKSLKRIGTIAGTSVFIMSILYILLALAAPSMRGVRPATTNITLKSFIPDFNFAYFTTISMLVFAVGGSEKMSPYVNNTENPSKEFPKGMLVLAAMVAVTALLGSYSMGLMFDANNIPKDLKMNGQFYAFQKLGEYYGVGNFFLILYSIANLAGKISAMMFSIDAPLKVLLADPNPNFVPASLTKTNKHGAPINGYILTTILVGILIILPAFGMKDVNTLFNWLLDLNSIVMPLRYLWVFLAYIVLRKSMDGKFASDYKFINNSKIASSVGIWCFVFTAFACIMGMFPKGVQAFTSQWYFQLVLNILTPFILLGLGLILPKIARKSNKIDDSNMNKSA